MTRGTVTVQTILAWDTGRMVMFRLNGDVSSENLTAIGSLLAQLLDGQVTPTPDGLHIDGVMEGDDARDVNLEAYRFRRHLYYAICAILVSTPSSYSEGVRYPSPF